ncbi:MAG: hypothetical protein ABSA02_41950 [Trebonia sp.]|jgi:hypothetical protein
MLAVDRIPGRPSPRARAMIMVIGMPIEVLLGLLVTTHTNALAGWYSADDVRAGGYVFASASVLIGIAAILAVPLQNRIRRIRRQHPSTGPRHARADTGQAANADPGCRLRHQQWLECRPAPPGQQHNRVAKTPTTPR